MNCVTPYYFLNRSRLARIETSLKPMLTKVVQRWWPQAESVHIKVRESTIADIAKDKIVRCVYQSRGQYLLFFGTDKQWSIAVNGWLGCSVDQLSPLTKELESQYCQELASSIYSDARPSNYCNGADTETILTSYLRPGAGALVLEVTVNGFTHNLLTTAAMFPHIFENEDTARNLNLVDVANALDESKVVLEAHLASSKVPLINVAALLPGDFLNLKQDLSGEIFLIGKNTNVVINAELGQRGNNKAARIIAKGGN